MQFQGFKVLLTFLPLGVKKQKLHLHNTVLVNKYMSTNNKLLPHLIRLTSVQTEIKVVVNIRLRLKNNNNNNNNKNRCVSLFV